MRPVESFGHVKVLVSQEETCTSFVPSQLRPVEQMQSPLSGRKQQLPSPEKQLVVRVPPTIVAFK